MSQDMNDLTAVESALSALIPLPAPLDRDRLLFQAGRASAVRRVPWWPCAAAAFASSAVTLGLAWSVRPAPRAVERVEVVRVLPKPAPVPQKKPTAAVPGKEASRPPDDGPLPASPYLKLERQVLRWGLDAVPNPPTVAAEPPASVRDLSDVPSRTSSKGGWRFDRLLFWGDKS